MGGKIIVVDGIVGQKAERLAGGLSDKQTWAGGQVGGTPSDPGGWADKPVQENNNS